jgi:hypothetical protein
VTEAPPVEAEVIDPGDQVDQLGPLNPTERVELDSELHAEEATSLAGTGHNEGDLFVAGLVAVLVGFLLVSLEAWRRRPPSR